MKRIVYFLGAALFGMATLISCDDNGNGNEGGGSGGGDGTGGNDSTAMVVRTMTALDVSAYDQWVYVSFADGQTVTQHYESPAPENWDIALHRENVKTNNGSAIKTDVTSFEALTTIPAGSVFMKDELTYEEVSVDMSQMMQGIIVYDTTEINMVLEDWVTRSGMPPTYTVQPNVYVVKTEDGQYAKIQFTSYKGGETGDANGYATFIYGFPFLPVEE